MMAHAADGTTMLVVPWVTHTELEPGSKKLGLNAFSLIVVYVLQHVMLQKGNSE